MPRDDFTELTIRTLQQRAGGRCSNPACRLPTFGPGDGSHGVANVGTAAHITAASPGGPRYDPCLKSEERQEISNGIWLCSRCARLVDGSPDRYTVKLLRKWKHDAEGEALSAIGGWADGSTGKSTAVLEHVIDGHKNFVWDVAVTPDGRCIISASNDKTVLCSDLHSGAELQRLGPHGAKVLSVAVSPDSSQIAAGQLDGTISIWELATGQRVTQLHHGAGDAKVEYTSASEILSGGGDGYLRLWNLTSGSLVEEFIAHQAAVLKVTYAEGMLLSASADRSISIWDADNLALIRRLVGHTGEVNSVAISCSYDRLLTASEDRTVRVWEISSGACVGMLRGHSEIVWRVAVSRDCRYAASGSGDNCVLVWDLMALVCVDNIEHPDCVAAVAFSPIENRLTVGCDDHKVYVYRLDDD